MNTKINKAIKILTGSFWMAILSGLVIAFIVILNWFPTQIQQNRVQRYDNIEALKKVIGPEHIMMPIYIPENISWQPSFIIAQKKPFYAVVMEFVDIKTNEPALFIIQSSTPEAERKFQKLSFIELKEEIKYDLKGKNAILQVGSCEGNNECSKMIWQEGDVYCSVFLMSSSFNLIRIAESMMR